MSQTLQLLLAQFNNAHIVTIKQAGAAIGLQQQTTYNQIHTRRFPIPLVDGGGKRMVRVIDIAAFIDGLPPSQKPFKVRRGRPTHKERAAREAARRSLSIMELQTQASITGLDKEGSSK